MAFHLLASTVCLITCHGGAAQHFSVYAKELANQGHTVQIYACKGPALKKFQEDFMDDLHVFSLEEGRSEEQVAEEIVEKCQKASVIITDVGHAFDITLQKAFAKSAPEIERIAYYDNPEAYVPGGYSEKASQVMTQAKKVLFANANLAKEPIYRTPLEEVFLSEGSKIGLGYYPLEQVETLVHQRASELLQIRQEFFERHSLSDTGQKVLVYAGGNNEVYFLKALPACLQQISSLSLEKDVSDMIFVLQQHPGAKAQNRDVNLIKEWLLKEKKNPHLPKVIFSDMSTEKALTLADTVLYYQTSMGPQFILAGIPTIQIGHEPYEDLLVRNQLCFVADSAKALAFALEALQNEPPSISQKDVEAKLGILPNWAERLGKVITHSE